MKPTYRVKCIISKSHKINKHTLRVSVDLNYERFKELEQGKSCTLSFHPESPELLKEFNKKVTVNGAL